MKTPGPQNPGVLKDDSENAERSLYLFFAAFFLAAGFFAAFFLAAMLVLPPSLRNRTHGCRWSNRVLMSQSISSARSLGRRVCAGNDEPHHFRSVVINECDRSCQCFQQNRFPQKRARSSHQTIRASPTTPCNASANNRCAPPR